MSNGSNIIKDYSIRINDYNPHAFCLIRVELDEAGEPYDWTFLYCNDALAKLEGLPKEKILGHRFFELFPNGSRKWLKPYYESAYEGKATSSNDISEEIDKYLQIETFPTNEKGVCACILRDIKVEFLETENQKLEILNGKLAGQLRALDQMHETFNVSGMGSWSIYLLEGEKPRMEAGSVMLKLLGLADQKLTPEEVYTAWFSNIVPSAVQSVLDSVEKMKAGYRDENTYLWKHPTLGERYVRCGGVAKPVAGGFVLQGYHYDVDAVVREQKKKDKALAEQAAIINTLSRSFRNVFVANLEDGTARAIRLEDSYKVKAVRDVEQIVFSFDTVLNRWIKENVHPDDKEKVKAALNIPNIKKVLSEQDEIVGNYRNIEDGVVHHYQYDIRRIGDTENVVAGFQIIDAIIEEQEAKQKREKELEEAHLKEEQEHTEVISSLSTIYSTIFRADIDTHRYEILNSVPLMEKVAASRGNFDDVKEVIIENFMVPEYREMIREFLDLDTLADRLENVNTIAVDFKAPTGQWMQGRFITKRRDENGRAVETLYVARDITEEKNKELKQQNALTQALAAAQQANKAKTTFLNSMSHDIRTPMNAIIGFTALAQTHLEDHAQVEDYLSKISTSSNHLLSLINDILDMSRIESGTVKLDEKAVHIPDLLHDQIGRASCRERV